MQSRRPSSNSECPTQIVQTLRYGIYDMTEAQLPVQSVVLWDVVGPLSDFVCLKHKLASGNLASS